jgi:hypothetical protein
MDLFKAEDMQKRANFLALMFFVMALGLLVIYGVLGWATNVLAQVCCLAPQNPILRFEQPLITSRRLLQKKFEKTCFLRLSAKISLSLTDLKILLAH